MGLYIPGTSIRGCGVGGPIGCGCPCYNPYNGRCQVVNKDVGDPSVLGFPDFCPLVHVRSPHGRLIDADAPIEVWEVRLSDGDSCSFRNIETTVSKFLLSHLMGEVPPTIIPKEGQ